MVNEPGLEKGERHHRIGWALFLPVFLIILGLVTSGFVSRSIEEKQVSQAEEEWIGHMQSIVDRDEFYPGLYLDGIHLEGMTYDEASDIFQQRALDMLNKYKIELEYEDQSWVFDSTNIGAHIDWKEKLDEIYQQGRKGNLQSRYYIIQHIMNQEIHKETTLTMDISMLQDEIIGIADSLYIEAVDANIDFDPQAEIKFSNLKSEKAGQRVDGRKLHLEVEEKFLEVKAGATPEPIIIEPEPVKPSFYAKDLSKATDLIVSYSTGLGNSTANRIHNIVFSLSKANGMRLNPGEVFSFNDVVGSRSKSRGFLPAPIIMPDKSLQDGYGGGVCQSSTTMFNAAALAGLEIVERSHHSYPVSYIPKGYDASVYYGSIDLKFKNNKESPVYINSYQKGNRVYVEIYGEKVPNNRYYKLETELLSEEPMPEPKRIEDKKGKYVTEAGKSVVHARSRAGYKLNTYRVLYEGDKKISSKLLVNNYYRPIEGIIYYKPAKSD
ncbi:MAG TPA: VanW family protein [Bacillota bacterium]|nr:VanW family protein [Bacillota bacterium]